MQKGADHETQAGIRLKPDWKKSETPAGSEKFVRRRGERVFAFGIGTGHL